MSSTAISRPSASTKAAELKKRMKRAATSVSTNYQPADGNDCDPTNVNVFGLIVKAEDLGGPNSDKTYRAKKFHVLPGVFQADQYDHLPSYLCSLEKEGNHTVLKLPIRRPGEKGKRESYRQKLPELDKDWEYLTLRPMQEFQVVVWGSAAEAAAPSPGNYSFVELLDLHATKKEKQGANSRSLEGGDAKERGFFVNVGASGVELRRTFASNDMYGLFSNLPDHMLFVPSPEDLPGAFGLPPKYDWEVRERDPLVFLSWDGLWERELVCGDERQCLKMTPDDDKDNWKTKDSAAQQSHGMMKVTGVVNKWNVGSADDEEFVKITLKVYSDVLSPLGFAHVVELWETVAPYSVIYCPFFCKGWITQDTKKKKVNRKHLDAVMARKRKRAEYEDGSEAVVRYEGGSMPHPPERELSEEEKNTSYELDLVAIEMYFDVVRFLTERAFPVSGQWVA